MTSRGTGTRLIRPALSTSEVVPVDQAMAEEVKWHQPAQHEDREMRDGLLTKILVKTNVSTPIITSGFSRDQNTPRDMFR